MADGFENREDIYSKAVRAGKRTYFFDVKATRGNDLYLTITESKKRFADDGKHIYEKHKLFLYKEDFEKFLEGINDCVDHIHKLKDSNEEFANPEPVGVEADNEFTTVDFEDLG